MQGYKEFTVLTFIINLSIYNTILDKPVQSIVRYKYGLHIIPIDNLESIYIKITYIKINRFSFNFRFYYFY